jgi:hypothetical protein
MRVFLGLRGLTVQRPNLTPHVLLSGVPLQLVELARCFNCGEMPPEAKSANCELWSTKEMGKISAAE